MFVLRMGCLNTGISKRDGLLVYGIGCYFLGRGV